ncbi:MAG: RluA family pseudouridine synthase [bacterium]|nr:RluA family pseudouridine synthase [bacterium]
MIRLQVEHDGELLPFLLEHTDYSRNKIKSLLKYRNVSVGNQILTRYDTYLKKGQVVTISLEKKETKIGKIDIIYEDEHYLVVNKPSGMLTIATEKEKNRTLYHFVREYVKKKNKHQKIFIVHRLDQDTCGIVLFSKDESLKQKLQGHWDQVAMKREYTAVVVGILANKKDKLVSYLKENQRNIVYSTKDKSGKLAITSYEVKKENHNSLLSIVIETGRKNQIRVQLNDIGHPIIGDRKYGNVKSKKLLLCANCLWIKDPLTSKVMKFEIHYPREFIKNV